MRKLSRSNWWWVSYWVVFAITAVVMDEGRLLVVEGWKGLKSGFVALSVGLYIGFIAAIAWGLCALVLAAADGLWGWIKNLDRFPPNLYMKARLRFDHWRARRDVHRRLGSR